MYSVEREAGCDKIQMDNFNAGEKFIYAAEDI